MEHSTAAQGLTGVWVRLLFILGVMTLIATPLQAQSAPTTSTCPVGGSPSSGTRGDGDDIKCRIGNILTRHQTLIDNLTARFKANCDTGSTIKHCDLIQDHLNRAQRAHNRAGNANGRMQGSDYSDLNKLRKNKCNGKNSDCASGNGTISGGETDPGVGSDIADHLDDAANGLDTANAMLSDPSPSSPSLLSPFPVPSGFDVLYDYTMDPDYPTWLHTGEDPKIIIPTVYALKAAENVAEGVEKVTEDACKQEAVVVGEGGNTSLACMVLTIAEVAIKTSADLLEFQNNDTTGWDAHGAYLRAGNIYNNLNGVEKDLQGVSGTVSAVQSTVNSSSQTIDTINTEVQNLKQQLDNVKNALQTQISNVQNEVDQRLVVSRTFQTQLLQLLLVPDGQRTIPASLLTCTGDKSTTNPCPPIVITCSPTTGQCSFNK